MHPILLLLLPGGTIVPGGGYVAGRQKLIGAVAARLAAPGIGIDAGQVSGTTLRLMYQGGLAVRTKGQLVIECRTWLSFGGSYNEPSPAPAGLFLGPQTTGESLKGGRLVAEVLSREGFSVVPAPGMRETFAMITAIHLGSRERMVAFCKAVQKMSPIGSYIEPEPGESSRRLGREREDPIFSAYEKI